MNHEFVRDVTVGVCELNDKFQPSRQVSFRLYYKETHQQEEPTKEFYEELGKQLYQGIIGSEKQNQSTP